MMFKYSIKNTVKIPEKRECVMFIPVRRRLQKIGKWNELRAIKLVTFISRLTGGLLR